MSVQLVVKQEGREISVTVDLPPPQELGGGEGVTADAERATASAALSCFSAAAGRDDRLTEEERHTLQLSPQEDSENTEVCSAVEFGELVRGGGDEVHALIQRIRRDPQVRDFTDDAARDEDPSQAIQTFVEVATIVFEVGDGGIGTFNSGRLLTMFYVAYDMCVSYLKRHGVTLIIQFVERLVGQLIRFLSRTGFFSWLFQTGGWRCVVAIAKTDRYFQGLFHGAVIMVAVGLGLMLLPGKVKSFFWTTD